MQNIGFAYTMIPLIKKFGRNRDEIATMLKRHLQLFNSNPYMSGPIIGSVVKLEEDLYSGGECSEADNLKRTLMAPYAAMGDSLFWGSLRPFSAGLAVAMALRGWVVAPLVFLLVYNSVHALVRVKGFKEGYRTGKGAIDFIREVNLPQLSRRIRWFSVVLLGVLAYIVSDIPRFVFINHLDIVEKTSILVTILFCFWLIRKGVSSLRIIYGASLLFFLIALW